MRTVILYVEPVVGSTPNNLYVSKLPTLKDIKVFCSESAVVQTIDLTAPVEQHKLMTLLEDPAILKVAYDASATRILLSRVLGLPANTCFPAKGWRCLKVWTAVLGLPDDFDALCDLLAVPAGTYIERANMLLTLLSKEPLSDRFWEEYCTDQEINDRGVLVDAAFATAADKVSAARKTELQASLKALTGLANPASSAQFKEWLNRRGYRVPNVERNTLIAIQSHADPSVVEAIDQILQLKMTSVAKYGKTLSALCSDNRLRGMFTFCGAARTGRWSSTMVQIHNLPRQTLTSDELFALRSSVMCGNSDDTDLNDCKELLRTMFIPPVGQTLIIADFSAIEARVLSWLANETWRLQAFAGHEDIYAASASRIYGVPVEKNGCNAHLRQRGKVAELALGYGGGKDAMKRMGGLDLKLTDDELQRIVNAWRTANPAITAFWHDVDKAARSIARHGGCTSVGRISLYKRSGFLIAELPSGRKLYYPQFRINAENKLVFSSWGGGKRTDTFTHGAKMTENLVQAIARDLLSNALMNLRDERVVMHVHDEIVVENDGHLTTDQVCAAMCRLPDWAAGLPIEAEGAETAFYRKI